VSVAGHGTRGPLIRVQDLTVDFWNQGRWVNVVNRISFAVKNGESMGLVGESGCGKTTTAYTLLGYRRPNSRIRGGQVCLQDCDLLRVSGPALQRLRGKRIGLVPQNPTTALSPSMHIGDQIMETMAVHDVGSSVADRRELAAERLSQMQLPNTLAIMKKYPHQLSGGQQQRVTIAMALACDPELLVLDEPTTGLDVTTQAQIIDLLIRLRAERGMAMVYVTHNLGVLAKVTDRISVMYAGELVEDAPTRELFCNPCHPYTRGLIASVPRLSAPQRGRPALLRGVLERDRLPPGCRFAPRCDFAEPINFEEPQVLRDIAPGHRVACRRAHEIPAFAAGRPDAASWPIAMPPADTATLLQVDTVYIAYEFTRRRLLAPPEPKHVVRGVSFDIRLGETFALVGESGSGKSTIARSIAGLIAPTSGHLTFGGKDITAGVGQRPRELRRELQLVLQNPDASLNPRQRIRDIIGRPLEFFWGYREGEVSRRVGQLLESIRLDQAYAARYPDELSGGERQRVAIARALAADPKLLLCDEVLSALDVSVQADILDLLRTLQTDRKIAYLFIAHDLAVVRSIAQRVGVLYRGELVELGSVEEVYSPPFHPYTHMLLSAVPDIEVGHKLSSAIRLDATPSGARAQGACPFTDRCPWKLGRICEEVQPPWRFSSETHAVRCHIALGDLAGREMPSPAIAPPPALRTEVAPGRGL
jgi:peptide/nickel transport system ATP-binding protein